MSSIQPLLVSFAKNTGSLAAGVAGAYSITLSLQSAARAAHIGQRWLQQRGLSEEEQKKFDIYELERMGDGWLEQIKHQTFLSTQQCVLSKTLMIAAGTFVLSTALSKLCGIPSFAHRLFSYLPIMPNFSNQLLRAVKF